MEVYATILLISIIIKLKISNINYSLYYNTYIINRRQDLLFGLSTCKCVINSTNTFMAHGES